MSLGSRANLPSAMYFNPTAARSYVLSRAIKAIKLEILKVMFAGLFFLIDLLFGCLFFHL